MTISISGYEKISDTAKRWGVSERRVNTLLLENRIPGAVKFGTTWAIPCDAEKPKDGRVKSGKYIKKEEGGR